MQAQLSAIFNHAVKFYELPNNPAVLAGLLGQHHADEMLFWTIFVFLLRQMVRKK